MGDGMRRLRLLLADDHTLVFEAIRCLLENDEDLEIVACAEDGSRVLPLVERTKADLVVLDLKMPGMDGLECLKALRERFPKVRVAILSALDSDETIASVLRSGANAFISKSIDPADLPAALRRAATEEEPQAIGRDYRGKEPVADEIGLTTRELEVLRALAEGHSNKEIARTLWLAEQTVKFHLTNIYRKLGVASRTEAVHWAYRNGVLTAADESRVNG
jgi:DNA-binding NarL/FixJ family response regulator